MTHVVIVSGTDSQENISATTEIINPQFCDLNDLVYLESKSDIQSKDRSWLQHHIDGTLGMSWLASDYMSHVHKLMIKEGYSLHVFQVTVLASIKKKYGT